MARESSEVGASSDDSARQRRTGEHARGREGEKTRNCLPFWVASPAGSGLGCSSSWPSVRHHHKSQHQQPSPARRTTLPPSSSSPPNPTGQTAGAAGVAATSSSSMLIASSSSGSNSSCCWHHDLRAEVRIHLHLAPHLPTHALSFLPTLQTAAAAELTAALAATGGMAVWANLSSTET
eukprot:765733-Hanusia_phi.AAC.2